MSVTILLSFSQPPVPADTIDDRIAAIEAHTPFRMVPVEPADEQVGHSFYPDLYGSNAVPPSVLLVLDLARVDADTAWLESLPASTGVLAVAPRRDDTSAARVAATIPGVPTDVPRIFVSISDATGEWRLSVPGEVAPVWLARVIAGTNPVPISLAQLNAARLGFGRPDVTLRAALERGLPAARLEASSGEQAARALVALVNAIGGLDTTQPRAQDTNYLILPVGSAFVISEAALVWSIVGTVALLLLYAVSRPRRVLRYGRAMRHNIVAIVGLFAVLVLSLAAGNLGLRILAGVQRISPDPLILAAGKLSVGVLVLAVSYPLLHIRLRRSSAVYSGASLFLLLVGAVVAGAVSVILGAFFVLAFVFGFLFSLARPAWLKALALASAVAPGTYLLVALAAVADPSMSAALLQPPVWRELATAVLLLPLLLMFFRLEALTPRLPLLPVMGMLALVTLALVTATIIVDARQPDVIAVRAEVTRGDGDTSPEMSLAGPVRLTGPITVRLPSGELIQCSGVPCTREVSPTPSPLDVQIERRTALDRHTLVVRVHSTRPADSLAFEIRSSEPVQLYASSLPSEEAIGSTAQRFRVRPGPFPPAEVTARFVLRRPQDAPPDAAVTVSVATIATYSDGDTATLEVQPPDQPLRLAGMTERWTDTRRVEIP